MNLVTPYPDFRLEIGRRGSWSGFVWRSKRDRSVEGRRMINHTYLALSLQDWYPAN